jgi:hypothetical protein
MEKRPQFTQIKSYEEFSKYYWYREELQAICKKLGIDSSGMKIELNHNIEEYFKGNLIRKRHRKSSSAGRAKADEMPLTLETGLIECKFCFSQRFRDFFSEQTGIKNFKFNADMVATSRKVKEEGDKTFTLGDMLEVFYGRQIYAKYDKSCLQWNKFVKDFCSDPESERFSDKLKTASILWREVRNSTREKVYCHNLLEEFADKI